MILLWITKNYLNKSIRLILIFLNKIEIVLMLA